jgi:hypothetical protein
MSATRYNSLKRYNLPKIGGLSPPKELYYPSLACTGCMQMPLKCSKPAIYRLMLMKFGTSTCMWNSKNVKSMGLRSSFKITSTAIMKINEMLKTGDLSLDFN